MAFLFTKILYRLAIFLFVITDASRSQIGFKSANINSENKERKLAVCTKEFEAFEESNSRKWRILAHGDHVSDSLWAVYDLAFYGSLDCTGTIFDGGVPIEGNEWFTGGAVKAFDKDSETYWSSTGNECELFWVGMEFNSNKQVNCVSFRDRVSDGVTEARIQAWESRSKSWQNVVIAKDLNPGQQHKCNVNRGECIECNAQYQGCSLLNPHDSALFGYKVALSGNGSILAVGSYGNDENEDNSGQVRVFKLHGSSIKQVGDDIDGIMRDDRFGSSITLSADGALLAVGAPWFDSNGENSGHAWIFNIDGQNWVELDDIEGENAGDNFGSSIALSADGSTVAIGASNNDSNGRASDYVRVFKLAGSSMEQLGNNINGERAGELFGNSIVLSGNGLILAVGAPLNNANGKNSGYVRVFKFIDSVWKPLGNAIKGESVGSELGGCVALSADGLILAVGSKKTFSGFVRVLQLIGANWKHLGNDIVGERTGDLFGSSIMLSSNGLTVAVGAPGNDANGRDSGNAQVFRLVGSEWEQLGIDIEGGREGDRFGSSLALSADGSVLAVAAYANYTNDANGEKSGHVRVFNLDRNHTSAPSPLPSYNPSYSLMITPTQSPTVIPTKTPSPTKQVTTNPSNPSTPSPTIILTKSPSFAPTIILQPKGTLSKRPSASPTRMPSSLPTVSRQFFDFQLLIEFDDSRIFDSDSVERSLTNSTRLHIYKGIEKRVENDALNINNLDIEIKLKNQYLSLQPKQPRFSPEAGRNNEADVEYSGPLSTTSISNNTRSESNGSSRFPFLKNIQSFKHPLSITFLVNISFQSERNDYPVKEYVQGAFDSLEKLENYIKVLQSSDKFFASVNKILKVVINGDEIEESIPLSSTSTTEDAQGTMSWGLTMGVVLVGSLFGITLALIAIKVVVYVGWRGKQIPAEKKKTLDEIMIIQVIKQDDISTLGDPTHVGGKHMGDNVIGDSSIGFDDCKNSGGISSAPTTPLDMQQPHANEMLRIEVKVPPGNLGLIIRTPHKSPQEGGPMVQAIRNTSVFADHIKIGDNLVSVDGVDTSEMCAVQVSRLIASKIMETRILVFVRASIALV